jgi:hypothetical protein
LKGVVNNIASFSELLLSCLPQGKYLAFQFSNVVIKLGELLQLPISPNEFKAGAYSQQGGQLVQHLSVELEPRKSCPCCRWSHTPMSATRCRGLSLCSSIN